MDELMVIKEITLNAETSIVWNALVDPEITKQYMMGCRVVSDWKAGSKIQWIGKSKGREKIYFEGLIVKIDPGKMLQYLITSSDASYVDIPSNYIKVTYKLTRKFGKTELNVTEGDFSKVEDGKRRYHEADEGLEYTLQGLKSVLENTPASEKKKGKEKPPEEKEKPELNTTTWLPD